MITATTGTLESGVALGRKVLRGLVMGLLSAVLVACPCATFQARTPPLPHDSLDDILGRGVLRVASRINPASFVVDRHGPAGMEHELAQAFASELGVELEMVPVATLGEVYAALDAGQADIAAAGLSERRNLKRPYRYSAPYFGVSQQVVYRSGTARPTALEDLVGSRLMVLAQSSSADVLRRAQAALPGLGWMEATQIDTADLLAKLAAGDFDYAILKSHEFYAYEGLFPSLEVAFELPEPEQLSWAVATEQRNDRLYGAVQAFLAAREASGELDLLREQFFGFLPEINRRALKAFARRATKQLPRMESLMRRIGEEEGIDWRLLAAISYQESHWNPRAVSRKGATGMMMLMKAAASEVGVTDRTDMEQSLRGGARYFRKLVAQMDPEIPVAERELFALAAYNMGPAHLEDARRIARVRGVDPNRWTDVEAQLPLLAQRQWRAHTRHGYARGTETVGFVSRIRQYHRFLAHQDDLQVAMNLKRNAATGG